MSSIFEALAAAASLAGFVVMVGIWSGAFAGVI